MEITSPEAAGSGPPGSENVGSESAVSGGGRSRPRPLRAAVDRIQAIDARSTWQVAAGAILVPLGIVIILISWYGSAHTAYVQQQIPYLVSGSFIGLGFMIVGGLLYWAHWLYRVYDQADLQHTAQLARQEELFERLIEAVGASAAINSAAINSAAIVEAAALEAGALDAAGRTRNGTTVAGAPASSARRARRTPVAAGAASAPAGPPQDLGDRGDAGERLVATATGTNVHRADCPIVARHPVGLRRLSGGDTTGLSPCRICQPRF